MIRLFFLIAWVTFTPYMLGCGRQATEDPAPVPPVPTTDAEDGHAHDDAPHGGTLVDWGGGAYHVEFTVDHDQKQATVYILGDDAKTPAPIKADSVQLVIDDPATELALTPSPLEGETAEMSSRFVGTHDTIGIVKEYSGTVSAVVDGTPYTADFKEEPHADH